MARAPEPDADDMLWTVAMARIVFGPAMNIQAPPNLSPGLIGDLIAAGINDWGGVSPVTPDHVNPGSAVARDRAIARRDRGGGQVSDRAAGDLSGVCARGAALARSGICRRRCCAPSDADGYARGEDWAPGLVRSTRDNGPSQSSFSQRRPSRHRALDRIVATRQRRADGSDEGDIVALFQARGGEFDAVCAAADALAPRPSAATPSAMSSTATSTTPTSATTAAGSAPSPRAGSATACAARPTTSTSTKSRAASARPGIAAPPKSACRAASIRATPARPIFRSSAPPSAP